MVRVIKIEGPLQIRNTRTGTVQEGVFRLIYATPRKKVDGPAQYSKDFKSEEEMRRFINS